MTTDTATKTLRQLLEEAAAAIDYYKSPDIDEARERLDAVLKAAGLGSTDGDDIVAINACAGFGGYFEIRTEWSARSCPQTSSVRLPYAIVDNEDPVQKAKEWRREKTLREAQDEVCRCEAALSHARTRLSEAETAA